MPQAESIFDIIIAGGGTTGCVIAGRLTAADASLRILVVETGPHTRDDVMHRQPARFKAHLHPESKTVKFNVAKESAHVDGRAVVVPCGQCLGGGSSVNFMMYTRAAASDYQDWETIYGNEGWGFDSLLPFLRKCESYQIAPDKDTHGYSGPIKISYGGVVTDIGNEFLEVAAQYDKDRGSTSDPSAFSEINKYARWQKYIDAKTGTRSDVVHHYLYNQEHNKNLVIKTGYIVKRVIFENHRAVGIEYVPNARFHPDAQQETIIARAEKLVVVSAGAFGSPAILERSGIGAAEVLKNAGVSQRVELPGVGENYQDHQSVFVSYHASEDSLTLDGIIRREPAEIEKWSAEWEKNGKGLMATNGIDAGIKFRPSPKELTAIGPDFTREWQRYFVNAPDKPVLWMGPLALFGADASVAPERKYFAMVYFIEYPESIVHTHITSGEDVGAPLDFDPAFLSRPGDLALLKYGYKWAREFARRLPSYRGEYAPTHPAFLQSSSVACTAEATPVAVDTPDLEYSDEDEKALEEYTRKQVGTTWHSLGTCAMKPREQNGVVDSKLNVYGVEGLKVADMSIAPANVSANTYSTAVIIGEKAAMIIAEELGIVGV
ncbi:alcohol oxidase [Obba rivulosa]|uniref:Alcohol oxidase n=1 Tax=Obba rivulosa TaxID=1052685 RepID=A0A8E2AZC2_9APHY|nr:alcohol oxidase [Obba rivulosa]